MNENQPVAKICHVWKNNSGPLHILMHRNLG
jgi:hypothetical protein